MTKKVRVWRKEEIRDAFSEYLMDVKLIETDDWKSLSVDESNILTKRHFDIFFNELKRYVPRMKMKLDD